MSDTVLDREFFHRDCLEVCPELVGKIIVRTLDGGGETALRITETEAYRGTEDTACHASKGRTKRNEMLWREAGTIYVYMCYGIHAMLNVITGEKDQPQGALIRACLGFEGPGKLTKKLMIDKSFNGMTVENDPRLRIISDGTSAETIRLKRVGIDYAEEKDRNALWRWKAAPPSDGSVFTVPR